MFSSKSLKLLSWRIERFRNSSARLILNRISRDLADFNPPLAQYFASHNAPLSTNRPIYRLHFYCCQKADYVTIAAHLPTTK